MAGTEPEWNVVTDERANGAGGGFNGYGSGGYRNGAGMNGAYGGNRVNVNPSIPGIGLSAGTSRRKR